MRIRKATITDAEAIAQHMLLAMENIVYSFIGVRDAEKAKAFMLHFTSRKNNQYSWQNCWVLWDEGKVVAVANVYDGAELYLLREPVLKYIRFHFNNNVQPEDETQAGEYYIDALGVSPHMQGKGVGSKLLQFLIDEYIHKQKQTLGLLVDEDNPHAKRLYLRLGFIPVDGKQFMGKKMEHLQMIGLKR